MNFSETNPSKVLSYCPRCGSKGFHFEKKSFSCPVCHFVFYINASTAVAVILETSDGKIVLTKRKYEPKAGTYDLPGGFVDVLERAEDAVKREIFEELGIQVEDVHFLASFPNEYPFKGISYFTCDLAFVCKIEDVKSLKPADDVSEFITVLPEEINYDSISFPSIKYILQEYVNKRKVKKGNTFGWNDNSSYES